MKWKLKTVLCLLWMAAQSPAAPDMTLEQAGMALGAVDKTLALEAEAVLLQGGWDALGTLDAIIFSGDAEAAMRAKHCRRCILYGLPPVLPDHLFSGITGFHRLDEQEQSQVLGEIQNTPAIGPAALAYLHSRLIERGFDEAALKKVEQTLKQIISRDVRWAGPGTLDPRLLFVPSRALVFNQLPHQKATKADIAAYAEWVALDPNITHALDERGVLWECARLSAAKALTQALEWLPRIENETARQLVITRLKSWCRSEIKDWSLVEPAAMQGALLMLMDIDKAKAREVYRTYMKADVPLSGDLHPGLRILEIERLLEDGQTAEAFGLAMSGDGSSGVGLMRLIGQKAWLEPGVFPAGLPDASLMELTMAEGFLDGYLLEPRRQEDLWWRAVATFREWLDRSANPEAWLNVLGDSAASRDLQIAVYAARGRFAEALEDGKKSANGYFIRGLARQLRKQPELCVQLEADEKNLMFIQGVIGNMWEEKQSDKGDLREVMRITAGWRELLPGLIPMDDSKRELVPYVAIVWWDSGQRIECLNLLTKTNLSQFGARLAAGLLHEIDDDDLLELLGKASLPEGALGLWLLEPDGMTDSGFERRCRLIEQLDNKKLLENQRISSRDADNNEIAYHFWKNGQRPLMRQWLQACYWLFPESNQLSVLAGLMQLEFDDRTLDAMSQSPRALRRPLHRAVLLHAMGRADEAASLAEDIDGNQLAADLLGAAGRYKEAVRMRLRLDKKSDEKNQAVMAEIFGLDHDDNSDAARAKLGRLATESSVLSMLLGVGIEHHIMANFDQVHHSFRLIVGRALESIAMPALESRMVMTAAGESSIREQAFFTYLRLVHELQDRTRAHGILSRWLELTPAEIEARGGRGAPGQLFRCLATCGWEEQAATFLDRIAVAEGGWDKLGGRKAGAICGWSLGDDWRQSAIWRLMQLEHPGIDDVDAMIRVRQLKPFEPNSQHAEEMVALIRRHLGHLEFQDVRSILRTLSEDFISPDLKGEDVELMLGNFLAAVSRYDDQGPRWLTREQDFWMWPDDMKKHPISENVVIQSMKQAHAEWNDGRRDEAKQQLRDLMMRALFDRDLPRSLHIYIISTFPGGSHSAGNRYDSVELLVRAAAVLRMPVELVGPEVEALCRMGMRRDETMIESAETLDMPELALQMQRQRMYRNLHDRTLSSAEQDVRLLRRLECRAAMASGNRDEVLAAFKRFIPADPYHEPFLRLMRQWFKNRSDMAGVDAVDQAARRFWKDRLLLLPGFGRYERQLQRWEPSGQEIDRP